MWRPANALAIVLCAVCVAGMASMAAVNDVVGGTIQDDSGVLGGTFAVTREHRAIRYTATPTTDPIARLNRRIANNEVRMTFDSGSGYLKPILAALNVPVQSQIVAFARGSLQSPLISPSNPRAIFFGDAVAVAWPRGGFIEAASLDPEQGVIFYTLSQVQTSLPTFARRDETCLNCHASSATLGVPGYAVASVVADAKGALVADGPVIMDHRTPIKDRWGGWYVTAKRLSMPHLGNLFAADSDQPLLTPGRASIEVPSLVDRFDTRAYPSAHSDVAAHLVFDHQTRMVNLLTRFGWEVRVATAEGGPRLDTVLENGARELVDYLLFVDEAPLVGPIEGSTDFARVFAASGPRDRLGRSLRDLDLNTRLLRYPCSYLVYSEQFDHLPPRALQAVYARMRDVLAGKDPDSRYRRLSPDDRRAIVEILRDTKKGAGF